MAMHKKTQRRESSSPPAKRRRTNNWAADVADDDVKNTAPLTRQDTGSTVVGDCSTQELEQYLGHAIDPDIPAETLEAVRQIIQEEKRERAAKIQEFAALKETCPDPDIRPESDGPPQHDGSQNSSSSESSEGLADDEPIPPKLRPLPTHARSVEELLNMLSEYMPEENAKMSHWSSYREYKTLNRMWLAQQWNTCFNHVEGLKTSLSRFRRAQWQHGQMINSMSEKLKSLKKLESDMRDIHLSVVSSIADGVFKIVCSVQEEHAKFSEQYKQATDQYSEITKAVRQLQGDFARISSLAWYAEMDIVSIGRELEIFNARFTKHHPPDTRVPETKSTNTEREQQQTQNKAES